MSHVIICPLCGKTLISKTGSWTCATSYSNSGMYHYNCMVNSNKILTYEDFVINDLIFIVKHKIAQPHNGIYGTSIYDLSYKLVCTLQSYIVDSSNIDWDKINTYILMS
jgi:hypothetical protein